MKTKTKNNNIYSLEIRTMKNPTKINKFSGRVECHKPHIKRLIQYKKVQMFRSLSCY